MNFPNSEPRGSEFHTSLIFVKRSGHFRSAKNFVKRLAEAFINQLFSEMATMPGAIGNIQIRLVNSS